jgi:hypothetical protein
MRSRPSWLPCFANRWLLTTGSPSEIGQLAEPTKGAHQFYFLFRQSCPGRLEVTRLLQFTDSI